MLRYFHTVFWIGAGVLAFLPELLSLSPRIPEAALITLLIAYILAFRYLSGILLNHGKTAYLLEIYAVLTSLMVVLFVNRVGGITSDFFFLYYFLSIGIAMLVGRLASTVLVLTILALYALQLLWFGVETEWLSVGLKFFALVFTLPISAFLATSYLQVQESKNHIRILSSKKKEYGNMVKLVSKLERETVSTLGGLLHQKIQKFREYLQAILTTRSSALSEMEESYLIKALNRADEASDIVDELEIRFSLKQRPETKKKPSPGTDSSSN